MIIFIYLLLLIISYAIGIANNKINFNTLYCGLIGYCGEVTPDKNALKILGIMNDTRGGDSCGIYSNKEVFYGVYNNSYFKDFFVDKPFPTISKEDFTCIMHARKSSVGWQKTSANAHPFLLKNQEGEAGFVGAHNGTLRNWIQLCKDRNISIINIDVDSHGLLACLYKDKTFKVLSEYEGGAALLFKDVTKSNHLYAFKGGGGGYEERPLYYYQKLNSRGKITGVYISSIAKSLQMIGAEEDEVISFKNNELISFVGGHIESSQIISRTADLNPSAPCPVSHNSSRSTSVTNYQDRLEYSNRKNKSNKSVNINLFVTESKDKFYNGSTIYFQKFRFFRNGVLLQGGFVLSKVTRKDLHSNINTEEDMENAWNKVDGNKRFNAVKLWFVNGVAFKNFEDFIKAKARCKVLKKAGNTCLGYQISEFSPTHPVLTLNKLKGNNKKNFSAINNVYFEKDSGHDFEYYNDFSPFIYVVKNGVLKELLNKREELEKRNQPNILDSFDKGNNFDVMKDLEEFEDKISDYFEDALLLLRNFMNLKEDEDVKFIYKVIFEFVFNMYSKNIVSMDNEDLEFLIELEEFYKLTTTNAK
jgi:hypothetical protein